MAFLHRLALAALIPSLLNGCAGLFTHSGTSVERILSQNLRHSPALPPAPSRAPASTRNRLAALAQPLRFQRPLKRAVSTSPFGPRGTRVHEGLDLQATEGTPIYAAARGRVVYVGENISGYGLTVILMHANRFSTLYAHTSQVRVELGQEVKRGDAIAYAGDTGNATAAHLHFEVRHELRALNPAALVPGL